MSGALLDRITCLPPSVITPFHEEMIPSHTKKLASSLRSRGWIGRPLVVMKLSNGTLRALTGSHRLYAALSVRLPLVPVIVLTKHESAPVIRLSPAWWRANDLTWENVPSTSDIADAVNESGTGNLAELIAVDAFTQEFDMPITKRNLLRNGFSKEVVDLV